MKKLTSSESLITINHYKNVLESEGIASRIKNEHLGSIVGEMPFVEVWPELWVINDLDYDRARQLIDAAIADTGAETLKDMGAVMGRLMPDVRGRVDGSVVSARVKDRLG